MGAPKVVSMLSISIRRKNSISIIFMDHDIGCGQDCKVHLELSISNFNVIFSKLEGPNITFQNIYDNASNAFQLCSTIRVSSKKYYHSDFHNNTL